MLSGTGGKKREPYAALSHPEYHDYSNETALEDSTGTAKSDASSFPANLYEMLEQSEEAGHSDIIRWMPHGRAFRVFDRAQFETDVLPCYFSSQTKYGLFHRQINMYGFRRLTHGPDKNCYYHERFLRGRPILSSLITRCRTFDSSVRQKCDPTTEPDFAKIPPVHTHVPSVSDRQTDPVVAESSMHPSMLEIEQCLMSETGPTNHTLSVPAPLYEARSSTERNLHRIIPLPELRERGSTEHVPLSSSYAVWYDSLYDNPIDFGDKRAPALFDPDMVNDIIAIFGTHTNDPDHNAHLSQER